MAVTFSALVNGAPYIDADDSHTHDVTLNNSQANQVLLKLNQYNPMILPVTPGSAAFNQIMVAIEAYQASAEYQSLSASDKSRWGRLMIIAALADRAARAGIGGSVDWR
jgi:hypothetical protein